MKHRFDITLQVQGPILTKSSNPASFGVDAAIARVAFGEHIGKPCLPGTHLEGKIREAWEQLGYDGKIINRLLGLESPKDTGELPQRGRLQITDLVATDSVEKPRLARHRIALEPELGSVKHGALQVLETPFAAGQEVSFKGSAWFYGKAPSEIQTLLEQGLAFLTHLGSGRSIGLGRLIRVQVEKAKALPAQPALESGSISSLEIILQPKGPLCIAKHKMDDNLFESEAFIPGNMIAGAVVETWAASLDLPPGSFVKECAKADLARSALATHFDHLRFRHAFAAPADSGRPRAIPLSWVTVGERFFDVSEQEKPLLLKNEAASFTAPAFLLDWKDFSKASAACGTHEPARELRVRTAIDSSKRTADRGDRKTGGGKLFAWELIHPQTDEDPAKTLSWHSRVDLHAVPKEERTKVAEQLASLLQDLGFVSKTKALCPSVVKAAAEIDLPDLAAGQQIALVLQTPGLLADPRFQSVEGVASHGALSAGEMKLLYRAAWSDLSGSSLEMSHHFARQRLVGGNYLARRYQRGKPYNPWLLTTEGSVFVLTVTDVEKARTFLTDCLQLGLPLPAWAKAKDAWGSTWQTNPFLRQNGFGELALHQPHPDFPAPQPDEFQPVPLP